MSRILVSFIGMAKAEPGMGERDGYPAVFYEFPANDRSKRCTSERTSLFGAALVAYLSLHGTGVNKWLVMGTEQSDWATLSQALPHEAASEETVANLRERVKEAQGEGFTLALLKEWNKVINANLPGIKCTFRITGPAETPESQMNIWKSLLEVVEDGDEIVLDVTHSFRHMPVLAAFMVNSLRWIRNVSAVDLYYGGLDLNRDGNTANVVHMPLIKELMDISEAAATYKFTGSYEAMLNAIGLRDNTDAQRAVLADELNRHAWQDARTAAENTLLAVEEVDVDSIRGELKPRLREALDWSTYEVEGRRFKAKAKLALKYGQYARALSMLWEGILVTGCFLYDTGDPWDYDARFQAEGKIVHEWSNTDIRAKDRKFLHVLEDLRNDVTHGTGTPGARVQAAMQSREEFEDMFNSGLAVLQHLLDLARVKWAKTASR